MARLLTRLFGAPEEIDGGRRCPTYLFRWRLCKFKSGVAVYIHHFVGDDWSRDRHDHPKRFISIGLRGAYYEQTPTGGRWYRAPWIRSFPATHIHRIVTPSRHCWTLVVVLKTVREWGFWHEGKWIASRAYVAADSEIANMMKSCPD